MMANLTKDFNAHGIDLLLHVVEGDIVVKIRLRVFYLNENTG